MGEEMIDVQLESGSYMARVDGGEKFFVGARTTYSGSGQTLTGLFMPASRYYGPRYAPEVHVARFGTWAYLMGLTAQCESKGFMNLINTYDRAAFTFGFLQFAAHTPNDNLILYFRRLVNVPGFAEVFSDIEAPNGKLISRSGGTTIDLEANIGGQSKNFMTRLNPSSTGIEDRELKSAAAIIHLSNTSSEARFLQISVGSAIMMKKMEEMGRKVGLDGRSDVLCALCMDIRHQGRGTFDQMKAALATSNPEEALLQIGSGSHAPRIVTLRATLSQYKQRGWLGQKVYRMSENNFV